MMKVVKELTLCPRYLMSGSLNANACICCVKEPNLLSGIFFRSTTIPFSSHRCRIPSSSLGNKKHKPLPSDWYRAVRPTR